MSLFNEGSSRAASTTSTSLFGDEPSAAPATSSSSLFADEPSDAPWTMPTPKKQARQSMVKNLLPANAVPESYVDAFDAVYAVHRVGTGVSLTGIKQVLSSSDLGSDDQARILSFVAPSGQESDNGLGRNEVNVLLALIGLAQEGDEITLDTVDERRQRLPQPKIAYIDQLHSQTKKQTKQQPEPPETPKSSPRKPSNYRQDSLSGDPTADPWAPTPAKSPRALSSASRSMQANDIDEQHASGINGVARTSNPFTAHGSSGGGDSNIAPTASRSSTVGDNAWGGYNGNSSGFSDQSTLGGGFGDDQGAGRPPGQPGPAPQPSLSGSTTVPSGPGEQVTVTLLPDKEGVFMFQHHNYEVKTIRRGSSVIRRYSDFVWLLDCLHKRYPFRRLPLLPPKRVQVNGTYVAADAGGFLEKRRRGLVRFSNALVQHPVLSQETLVVMFLTVPTYQELAVWRKQATISVQEEFTGKTLPPNLEDSLPPTLPELFDIVRTGVRRSSEVYINLCVLLERLVRRSEGLAVDTFKFSLALQSLLESSKSTYAVDTNDVPLLNEGIGATAKHMSAAQTLLEDEGRSWESHALEDLKAIRDAMVSMRDVFDRRDKYARDNIPQLERRIENSENKLQQLRNKPAGQVKPEEIEKVARSIISDKESIVAQHARGVFIKECIRDEIVTFQSTIYQISHFHQDWAQERVKYSELQASNWRSLVDDVESMPTGES